MLVIIFVLRGLVLVDILLVVLVVPVGLVLVADVRRVLLHGLVPLVLVVVLLVGGRRVVGLHVVDDGLVLLHVLHRLMLHLHVHHGLLVHHVRRGRLVGHHPHLMMPHRGRSVHRRGHAGRRGWSRGGGHPLGLGHPRAATSTPSRPESRRGRGHVDC